MRRLPKKLAYYRGNYHWLRLNETPPMGPFYINVEPTNACNLKCVTCSIDGSRKRGFMDLGLFRRIIDDALKSDVYEVAPFLAGEPLLHKELPEMVEYMSSRGLETYLVTNGCFLTQEKSEALLDAGISNIWISLDGDNKEDYEALRVGANYEEVLDNIIGLLAQKKRRSQKTPEICIHMIKMRDNPHQEPRQEFVEIFKDLPLDRIVTRNPHNWRGVMDSIEMNPRGKHYFPCRAFWSAMSIAWDGRVVGCSADLNGNQIFGDLKKQSIMEIWNGEEMVRHRRLLKEKRFEELPLCANCHILWYESNPKLHVLNQLPPFEQIRPLVRKFYDPKKKSAGE